MLCFWSFICQINASVLSKHSITFVVWIFPSTVFDRGIQQPEEKTSIRGHDLLKKSGCRSPFTLPSLKCSDCILHWFVVLETSLMAEISSETDSNSREHFLYSLCKNSLLAFYNRFFFQLLLFLFFLFNVRISYVSSSMKIGFFLFFILPRYWNRPLIISAEKEYKSGLFTKCSLLSSQHNKSNFHRDWYAEVA